MFGDEGEGVMGKVAVESPASLSGNISIKDRWSGEKRMSKYIFSLSLIMCLTLCKL